MKKLSVALGGKLARMMHPTDAERVTGYCTGGISPFGQKKKVPMAMEESSLREKYVFVNGGQRGLQICLNPNDVCKVVGAIVASLIR